MPDAYHHGIKVIEINEGSRTLTTVSTAVIGLVATGPAADVAAFPLNKPVLVTDIAAAMSKAGATGTLYKALLAISDQTQPVLVVVRVEQGADVAATTTNVIGADTGGQKTGMQALLAAEAQVGVRPRILGCPGLDTQAVTAALVVVAEKLRAFAYASCWDCDIVAEAVTYRANFSARELMLITPDFLAWDTVTSAPAVSYAVARAMGLRAKIDTDIGWHKTLSNVPVAGVLGLSRDIHFDLQSAATDAGVLNAAQITTLVNATGYRFWGSRTCSDDALFAFESATRTAQVLMDTIADGLFWAVDKPLQPSLVKDIVETINGKFRSLKTQGLIIGANAWFDPAKNTSANLSGGKVTIDYDYTPVPPLEQLTLNQRITDSYFANFADGLS